MFLSCRLFIIIKPNIIETNVIFFKFEFDNREKV